MVNFKVWTSASHGVRLKIPPFKATLEMNYLFYEKDVQERPVHPFLTDLRMTFDYNFNNFIVEY